MKFELKVEGGLCVWSSRVGYAQQIGGSTHRPLLHDAIKYDVRSKLEQLIADALGERRHMLLLSHTLAV